MFFKNIAQWSKKTMLAVTIIFYIIYFLLVVIAPTITIICKYNILENGMKKVTGFGIIVIVVCGLASYLFIKKAITKLPSISVTEQRFKFGIETLIDCIPLAIILFALFVIKDDLDLAFSTFRICMIEFFVAILYNGLFIKFIDAEWVIRNGAKFDNEKLKRKGVV